MKYWLTGLLMALAMPVFASSTNALIAQIERAGANETKEYRHEVEVQNCEMTTYRWKNLPDHGWTLWSSFKFDMRYVKFANDLSGETPGYIPVPARDIPGAVELALVIFDLTHGRTASHEFSIHRKVTKESEWSPRGDGKSFRVKFLSNFFYNHEGPGVIKKAEDFTNAFKLYVREHCALLG